MKNLIYLILSLCTVLLALGACGDNSTGGDGSNEPTHEKVADILNIQQGAGLVYRKALQETGDTLAALNAMGKWIGENPAISEAWYHDFESVEIIYKNGLKSSIHIVATDENGVHLTRGGGTAGGLKDFVFDAQNSNGQPHKIKNKKVLVLLPYTAEFEYSLADIQELRKSFESDFQVDIIKDDEVGLDDVNSMGDYGLIILDTHGQKHGFKIGSLERTFVEQDPWLVDDWTPENTKRELFEAYHIPIEKIENGEIEISQTIDRQNRVDFIDGEIVKYKVEVFTVNVLITENYIRNANIDLEDAIVFGNHCYSGHTADGPNKNNMAEAWRSKGAAAYYGYAYGNGVSMPVDNAFAKDMEKKLIKRLVEDTDTTGVAHLNENGSKYFEQFYKYYFRPGISVRDSLWLTKKDVHAVNQPLYFNHYFDTDYSYETCGTFTDPRDGEEYELACIGDQTWFAENLRYDAAGSRKPEGKEVAVHGLLYDYNTATGGAVWLEGAAPIKGICPTGWHVPHRNDWKTLLEELGSETDVLMNAHPDSIRKTVIRLAGADPDLDNYQQYQNDPELNQSGFSALATGRGVVPKEGGNTGQYRPVISSDPTFWSSSPMSQEMDGDGNPTGVYDTESRWHLELDMSQRFIWYNIVHPTVADYFNPIRCVKDN